MEDLEITGCKGRNWRLLENLPGAVRKYLCANSLISITEGAAWPAGEGGDKKYGVLFLSHFRGLTKRDLFSQVAFLVERSLNKNEFLFWYHSDLF